MLPTGLGIVNIGVWYGLIRWSILAVLIILTFALIHSDNKKVREATPKDRVNKRRSYAAFIVTLVAAPFLILEINFTPTNAPTEPVHHQEEKEEPEVVPGDIQPVTPDKKDEPAPSDSSSSDTPSVTPSNKPSTKPEEAPKGDEPTPSPEPTPEPKEVSYKVIHRQMGLDGTNYTTVDTTEGAGKTGDKVTPSVKSYTGFTSPSAQTVTLIDGDNTITYNYARNKYTLTLGDDIETTTPSGEYFYGATISIKAKSRQGYDFSHWLSNDETIDGKTDTTIDFTISDKTINIETDYAPRDDTPYTVIHYWQDVSGSGYTERERENKTGTTDQEVTPAVIDYTSDGFVSPDTQTGKINGNGETVFKYNYNRKIVQLTLEDADQIETSTPSGEYRYGTEISLTAKAKTGYHFVKWSDDVTSTTNTFTLTSNKTVKPIYEANTYTVAFNKNNEAATGGMNSQNATYDTAFKLNANQFTLARHTFAGWSRNASATSAEFADEADVTENLAESGTVTLYAIWAESSYLVHFDAQGGTSVSDKEIAKGAKIGTLPSTTREHYIYDGWFTQNGEQIDENTVINGEITFYAHWTKDITNATLDSNSVSIVRTGAHAIIVTTDENTEAYHFESADESIATVSNTGVITGVAAGNTTVNVIGDRSGEKLAITVAVTPKQVTIKFETDGGTSVADMTFDEGSKINPLPESTKTSYVHLGWFTSNDEKLDTDTIINADATYYAHWIKDITNATAEDISIVRLSTGIINVTNKAELEAFTYSSDSTAIATVTSEGVVTGQTAGETHITLTGDLSGKTKQVKVTVTPIQYTVHFDAQGGTSVSDRTIDEGQKVGTLPETSYAKHLYDGWFTEATEGTEIAENTTISGETTFYAHWTKDITNADVDTSDVSIVREGTHDIVVTPDSSMEPYTFSSNNNNIAAIDASGRITGVAAGTTEVNITGNRSHERITINVTVTPKKVTVKFETDGGTPVEDMEIDEFSKINPLPTTEKTGFTFLGWFTSEGENPLTTEDVIEIDTTFYAHWEEETHALVCRAAEELHVETCEQSGTNGCSGLTSSGVNGGLIEQGRITYGKIPDDQAPAAGNAYDCDVNGDGTYDPEQERFYYLADDGTNARLIYYSNYDVDKPDLTLSEHYGTSITRLPSKTHWTNSSLVEYDDGNISRFITAADYISACGINESNFTASGTLKNCIFIAERTQFVKPKTNDDQYRAGIWFHKEQSTDKYYRIQTTSKKAEVPSKGPNSDNSARPVIQVPLDLIEQPSASTYTISFDAQGGADVAPITNNRGEDITLPITTKTGYVLSGWSTTDFADDIIGKAGDIYRTGKSRTLYAIWEERDAVAYIDGFGDDGYQDSLQKAINKAPTDGTKKTITLFKDVNETLKIAAGKNIEFDFGDHVISYNGQVMKNEGSVVIKNGTMLDTSTTETKGAIDNTGTSATLIITGGTFDTLAQRQVIYNEKGRVEISGNPSITSHNNQRAAIHNKSNGTLIIAGGTITSDTLYAVYNEDGTMVIGANDGSVDTSSPTISGATYGVIAKNSYSFYDGTISGETRAIGTASGSNTPTITDDSVNCSKISAIETNSVITKDNDRKTFYLTQAAPKYLIKFDGNGGTASEASRVINQGLAIGELPTASKPLYDFLGWFTQKVGGDQISADTTPDGNLTYYAHWSAHSSDEIVEFNILNSATQDYFANISDWDNTKTNTALWTNLKNNFDSHQCKMNTAHDASKDWSTSTGKWHDYYYSDAGTNYCDRPNSYDTGITEDINVYLSNDNKDKLDQVNYLKIQNGTITNMIPDTIYRWESASDSNIYGYVKATGERRILSLSETRNVRDLGGLTGKDGRKIKYGKLTRGEYLQTDSDVSELQKLGMTKEFDLRYNDGTSGKHFSDSEADYKRPLLHYNFKNDDVIDSSISGSGMTNYEMTRKTFTNLMEEVAYNHENVYFHCSHGADRTGTLAWLIESILGVDSETMDRDYELTSLSGRPDRNRYYDHKDSNTNKYTFMKKWIATDYNNSVYDWYMDGSTNIQADNDLITAFQEAMLEPAN